MTVEGFVTLTSAATKGPIYLRASSITCFGTGEERRVYVHVIGGDNFHVLEEPEAIGELLNALRLRAC